ncbi:MAG: glycosyltransferase family 2 protein [Balneolia bacterium]|nr:glycosyltransferase family 2 protein [Balneolia bacterium]
MASLPTVTIALPVLNEQDYIEDVVKGFLNNSYKNIIEIIVADGGSTDKTREIMGRLSAEDRRVIMIDNPAKKQAAGMNEIIKIAKGELLVRADGHSDYDTNYVQNCVEVMQQSNALNVSGSQRHVAKVPFQSGVALASRTWFGNGGAHYKNPEYEGPSDTVFLGCFKTEVLREIGGYKLLSNDYVNEDAELNARLNKLKPGGVYVSPKIKVWYYPRTSASSLWKQYYFYGKSRKMTQKLHPGNAPFRSKLPFLAVSLALIFIVLDILIFTSGELGGLLVLVALLVTLIAAATVSIKFNKSFREAFWRGEERQMPGLAARIFYTWVSINTIVLAHSAGRFVQQIKHLFRSA